MAAETLPEMLPEFEHNGLSWNALLKLPRDNHATSAITYGIELQFLVPILSQNQPDPHPNDRRPVIRAKEDAIESDVFDLVSDRILNIIRSGTRVPAWTHPGPPYPGPEVIATLDPESQAVARMPAYSQWVAEIDQSLVPPYNLYPMYSWVGVKVKSSKRNTSWDNHFDQVGKVIVALRDTLRMRLGPTTSLMVHVGFAAWDISTLEIGPEFLRVFCTLWWFIEPQVQCLADRSRHTHSECQLLTQRSRLHRTPQAELVEELTKNGSYDGTWKLFYDRVSALVPQALIPRRLSDELEAIWSAEDAKAIAQMMAVPVVIGIVMEETGAVAPFSTWGRGSVGFQGFCQGAWPESVKGNNDGETGTIEFRSMEGTLDPLLIVNWLAVVIRLVDFARRGNHDDIRAIIHKALGMYSVVDLLKDLDLAEQATYFTSKLMEQESKDLTQEAMDTLFVPPYFIPPTW
ncbi:hypothetical protein GGS23DRAFT_557861 [Durotheca rogersii]|uniref:uncharacterized protein n=1 Tax=Durotheca rogersii TaxID=419775 RepID=UPI0022202267|nr:uncharacterized protein GGS23DRAFT_557861 [Durotheca rogersii]KAI5865138.1 hypothetical protein GGS23DRAFT_557861 [Durotheca rogersii]